MQEMEMEMDYLTTCKFLHIYVSVNNYHANDKLTETGVNKFVRVGGLVTKLSQTSSYLVGVQHECETCLSDLGFFPKDSDEVGPCPSCQNKGPFQIHPDEDIRLNYEILTLQDSHDSVTPVYTTVILFNYMIGSAQPGEEIEVTGINVNRYNLPMPNANFKVIEANHVTKKQTTSMANRFSKDEMEEIFRLSRDPKIGERIIKSIAPSIPGNEFIKTTLALAMFGGQEKTEGEVIEELKAKIEERIIQFHAPSIPGSKFIKETIALAKFGGRKKIEGGLKVRGDINVLLLCDPDTPISQFLKYVEDVAPKAVKVSAATGLAPRFRQNTVKKEWSLEGGPLVLAHKGMCIVDNFHQIDDQDRVTIEEAMKLQTIDTSNFGLVNPIQTCCSIIAAANPRGGRYDSSKPFLENVDLEDTIVSDFDVLCVLKDVEDKTTKNLCPRFVKFGDEDVDPEIIPQHTLKKYIAYARSCIFPRYNPKDFNEEGASLNMEGQGQVPAPRRHLQSMVPLAQACARMHLRSEVNRADIQMAINLLSVSLIATKKLEHQSILEKTLTGLDDYVLLASLLE